MPRELLSGRSEQNRPGPAEVYVTLKDLIAIQYQAHGFSFLPKYAVQSLLSGRHRSKLRGRGLDFDEVRKYIPGDDIRNIDWKVTARVGQTHTKVFTEEKERPVFFIVDQSSSMFFGSVKYFKSVVAARLAAIGCWRTMDQGDRSGGIVYNHSRIEYVSPKRNRKTIQEFLNLISNQNQELTAFKTEKKIAHPLNTALKRANELIGHDFLVVLISDLYAADVTTIKQLIRLRKNNDVIVAHISDPAEQELLQDSIVLTDGSYQTKLNKGKSFRRTYRKQREDQIETLRTEFKKYRIPYLPFTCSEEPSVQLREMLSLGAKKK